MASWRYDVFLSFRGEDTRNSFTSHLYEALVRAGINTFKDSEEVQRGNEISQDLFEAIDGSRFLVVVISKNYASSTWCLEELVRIMGCMERLKGQIVLKGQMVLPVFYNVDPSELRKQDGVFGEAFTKHEERFKEDLKKVQRWREALTKAANLSGWDLNHRSESTLIKDIVQNILVKINCTLLTVATNPVGIDYRIRQLKPALGLGFDDVRMIGIYGLGGIGKTTIAKAIYNSIANHFEGCSFLPNIKEKCGSSMHDGLVKLQELLLKDILPDKMDWCINFVDRGTNILRDRLGNKKVLIVLDDVDNITHLQKLAGNVDWFGRGSRIIITTRNKQLLDAYWTGWTYKVDELNYKDALELFCWNAFKKPHPDKNFDKLSDDVVRCAAGHPLALIVVGASLCLCSKSQWESELQKLRTIPKKEVHEILKLSFDGLEDFEKEIFLDIACFFRGKEIGPVMRFLDACGFYPDSGIEVLKKKCLICSENNTFQMHDMIELMGKEIVRQESPFNPGGRSRLWSCEDVLQVLNENEGTIAVKGIYLNTSNADQVCLQTKTFSKMKKLRLLIMRGANVIGTTLGYLSNELRWLECTGPSSSSIAPPSTFHPEKLVVLNIPRSSIEKFGTGPKGFETLRYINFQGCEMLTEICDISLMPNLVGLDLKGCSNLEFFSSGLKLKSLEFLNLQRCYKLKKFPDVTEEMKCLRWIFLNESGITELPTSIINLTGLLYLRLHGCEHLVHLPSSIYRLKNLESFGLSGCCRLLELPQYLNFTFGSPLRNFEFGHSSLLEFDFIMAFNCFNSLRKLYLIGSKIRRLPRGMSKFKVLKHIDLHNSKLLEDIPDLPPNISYLNASGCESLPKLDVSNFSDMKIIPENDYLWRNWTEVFLCQGINNHKMVRFELPGNEVPNSFIHCSPSGVIDLHVPFRKKNHLLGIMFCVVKNMNRNCRDLVFQFEICSKLVDEIKLFDFAYKSMDCMSVAYYPIESMPELDEALQDYTSGCWLTICVFGLIYSDDYEKHIELPMEKCGVRLIFSDGEDQEAAYMCDGKKRKREE